MTQQTINYLKDLSVLVVDDDQATSSLIHSQLEPIFKSVEITDNGVTGLASFLKIASILSLQIFRCLI